MKRLVAILVLLALVGLPSASRHVSAQATKVIFTATITGDGSDATPFRPSGFGTVANMRCIDLRKDQTVATGRMICGADTLPVVAGVNQIGDSLAERMTPPRKALIEAALGVTITASNVIDIIAELLITHGRTDGSRWKPLRQGADGKYRIYLGGTDPDFQATAWIWDEYHVSDGGLVASLLIWPVDVASAAEAFVLGTSEAWAASFTESWTHADNSSLTADLTWTKFTGTGCSIASNQASCSTAQTTHAREDSDVSTIDHTVQYKLVSLTFGSGTSTTMSVIGRKDSSATATYYACESFSSSSPSHVLYKRVAGTRTDLTTDTTDPASNDTIKLTMNGSSISCDRNGGTLMGPVTDSSISSGTRGGFRFSGDHATSSSVIDDFVISDINGATGKHRPIQFN